MSSLTITTRDATSGPVLEIAGDLDFDQAPRLRRTLGALSLQPGQRLVLDLSRLRFCDSSGIAALILARNRAVAARADIALAAVPAATARVLRIVGLDHVFPMHADADTATAVRPATGAPS
ncbi:STAS domain-containing protein [Streptomyces sp. NPDC023588]|uniref:STAS domain-containing protein n=1 Tax=Streptomyces sp. NPDC023588 TaxID=3154907 RepID=UPI003401C53A